MLDRGIVRTGNSLFELPAVSRTASDFVDGDMDLYLRAILCAVQMKSSRVRVIGFEGLFTFRTNP